jgi:hypothetical protein
MQYLRKTEKRARWGKKEVIPNRGTLPYHIEELGGQVLRVITLEDRKTIHNAFPDRRFKQ